MSYWFSLFNIVDAEDPEWEVFSENMTSNVAPMWREAGCDLRDLKSWKAKDCVKPLCDAINRMKADPKKYRAMNPANGWGNYDSCVEFLVHCHDACLANPESIVHISH